jgi:predicted alpha/beta-hydrolase family hydrolase
VREDGRVRLEISTPRGLAWADIALPAGPSGPASLVVLGHGAGGDVTARDLVAVRDAAVAAGAATALVTQPYRVAGRKSPAPAGQLDEAWRAVLARLTAPSGGSDAAPVVAAGQTGPAGAAGLAGSLLAPGVPLIVGGRSSGARVACRTATGVGAAGVVALAFPTHPPGRPERSRVDELRTGLPTLVVNGDRDPFGLPPELPGVDLVVRPGERHDLRGDLPSLGEAVVGWLRGHGWAR